MALYNIWQLPKYQRPICTTFTCSCEYLQYHCIPAILFLFLFLFWFFPPVIGAASYDAAFIVAFYILHSHFHQPLVRLDKDGRKIDIKQKIVTPPIGNLEHFVAGKGQTLSAFLKEHIFTQQAMLISCYFNC